MPPLERDLRPEKIVGSERAFEVKMGGLGGFELRPTRLFVWKGAERGETEKLVSLADQPVGLEYPRHESTLRMGGVEVRSRGNPLMTLALAGAIAFRRLADRESDTQP
jgi:hypothetical protein